MTATRCKEEQLTSLKIDLPRTVTRLFPAMCPLDLSCIAHLNSKSKPRKYDCQIIEPDVITSKCGDHARKVDHKGLFVRKRQSSVALDETGDDEIRLHAETPSPYAASMTGEERSGGEN